MFRFLDTLPYTALIVIAVWMLLAPVRPMPHVVEKLLLLKAGGLTRPIDIFDLFWHLLPTGLLLAKRWREKRR